MRPVGRSDTVTFWHQQASDAARELGHRILRRAGLFQQRQGRILGLERCCVCGAPGAIDSWEYTHRRLTGLLFTEVCLPPRTPGGRPARDPAAHHRVKDA